MVEHLHKGMHHIGTHHESMRSLVKEFVAEHGAPPDLSTPPEDGT